MRGDAGGLSDMRHAIVLARAAGDGEREVAWYNNLGVVADQLGRPQPLCRSWTPAPRRRGRTGSETSCSARSPRTRVWTLLDLGELDQALALLPDALRGAEAMENEAYVLLLRATETWIRTLRGEAVARLDWLETAARADEATADHRPARGAAAMRTQLGEYEAAVSLLEELDASPRVQKNDDYAGYLPTLVRTALQLGQPALAARLASGWELRTPRGEHALVAVNAALAESRGELEAAATTYADAAERWAGLGMVVEQAFALLGRGRCLLELSQPAQAVEPLRRARETFVEIEARPALADTDVLLEQATALTA